MTSLLLFYLSTLQLPKFLKDELKLEDSSYFNSFMTELPTM